MRFTFSSAASRKGQSFIKRSVAPGLCFIFLFLLDGCASPGTQKTAASCTLIKVASLPATVTNVRQILVPVGINGATVLLQLDTGSDQTVLFADAARNLGLAPKALPNAKMRGVNGETTLYRVPIKHFVLGDMIHSDESFDMAVVEMPQFNPGPSVAGLLGSDYFKHFDLEFDLEHKTVNLFLHHPCEGQAAYWPHEIVLQTKFSFGKLPVKMGMDNIGADNHVMIPIEINGQQGLAALDSGAATTAMTWRDARSFGITPETEGVKAGGGMHGIGDKTIDSSSYIIPSIKLGDEIIHNIPTKLYQPVREHNDRLILFGVDFLLKNHVYIAYDEKQIYFTPYRYKLAPSAESAPP